MNRIERSYGSVLDEFYKKEYHTAILKHAVLALISQVYEHQDSQKCIEAHQNYKERQAYQEKVWSWSF